MNVIGGGPVGLWAAKKAGDKGIDAVVYEKNKQIGVPEHCTGLHSQNLDKILKPEVILNQVNGARFYSGKHTAILEKKKVARVIDRTAFDCQVYEEAVSSGVKVILGKKVNYERFKGEVVIAEGACSESVAKLGQKIEVLPAMQYDLKERPEDDFVELWFEKWNPNFFIWVVPRGNGVRVGTASKNLLPLKNFILKRFGRFRLKAKHAGLVVTSGPVKKTYFHQSERNIFLVGDSAGQVKPTTGGGVYTGMMCAEKISEAILNGRLSDYEKLWKKELSRELKLQRMAYLLMNRNPHGFVKFLKKNKTKFETQGDMDMQFKSMSRMAFSAIPFVFGSLFSRRKV